MKPFPAFLSLLALLLGCSGAFADKPVKDAPAIKPAPPVMAPATNAAPVDLPLPELVEAAPPAPTLKFDDYLNELTAAVKLTDAEKKAVQGLYEADGNLMKNMLNNDSLSPFQKAAQSLEMRNTRNTKIEAVLVDPDRKLAFEKVEAKYRVALTELAADSGWAVAPAPVK